MLPYGGDLYDASSVQLADGRVLVIDPDWEEGEEEEGSDGALARAEIWDPATNNWSATASLLRPRSDYALVALRDGRALVAGGLNAGSGDAEPQSYSSAYAFDPRTETWEKVGLMGYARTAPSATLLRDGRVLVAGGYFRTGWQEESSLAPAPADVPTAVLAAYRPETTTGRAPSRPPHLDVDIPPYGYAMATTEIFDPATGRWSATGPMRYARVGAEMVTLTDGRVLVVGSSSWYSVIGVAADAYATAEIYDPATGRFGLAGRLPAIDRATIQDLGVTLPEDDGEPASIGVLVAQPDGGAVLVGYASWWKHEADVTRTLRFDARTGRWDEIGQPCAGAFYEEATTTPGCRQYETTVGLRDGSVLAVGGSPWVYEGEEQPELVTNARQFDPGTATWTTLPPVPLGGAETAAIALGDGSALIFGRSAPSACGDGLGGVAYRFVPGP